MKRLFVSAISLILLTVASTICLATVENRQADLVLGQNDFTHKDVNILKDSGLSSPYNVAVDTISGRVYVCDYSNNRVLWWNSTTSTASGRPADGVLGQPDFASNAAATTQAGMNGPYALSVDISGNVWVADANNHRVLEYPAPISSGMQASIVLGQAGFSSNGHDCTQSTMYAPRGVIADTSGNVWVVDYGNNRILKYPAPISTDMAASVVLGQDDFTTGTGTLTSTGTYQPRGVGLDSAPNVWVADNYNNRVLKFAGPIISSGMAANVVLGQSVFTTRTQATTQTGLRSLQGLAVDRSSNVWVADTSNNRVLEYKLPIATNEPADIVLGQSDFTSQTATCTSAGMNNPFGLSVDGSGNVWVADTNNNRVLKYSTPISSGMPASLVLGQSNFVTKATNMVCPKGLNIYQSGAVDASSGRVYVCDSNNNRVLWWNSSTSLANGQPADGVLGQPDFVSNGYSCSQTGMHSPQGVSVDGSGNVWVSDSGNYRVLKYIAPTTNGQAASLVLGQPNFDSNTSACTQTGMEYTYGVKVDGSGNVWVVDMSNNRVLKYTNPTTNGQAASLVLGQPNFSTNTVNCTQTGMSSPCGLDVDSSGNVWVANSIGGSRVLKYTNPTTNGQAASLVLGQPNFDLSVGACSATGLSNPYGVSVDGLGNVWVADMGNHRVLKYTNPTTNGQAASLVLGQADFILQTGACTQTGMYCPAQLNVDSFGNVWVVDSNYRILRFNGIQTHSSTNGVDPGSSSEIIINPWSGEIKLNISAGTFGQAVNVTLSTSSVPTSDRPTIKVGNICIEITNNLNLQPGKPITITMHYRDSDVAGLDESKLAISRYDALNNLWTPLPSTVDTANNVITAITNHLSKFVLVQLAPAADLGSVKVFPNPLNSKLYSLTITNLTASADIKIYNVAGELIRKLDYSNGTGVATWDGKNDSGSLVASGVYIIYIKSDSGTKKIKVAVEK